MYCLKPPMVKPPEGRDWFLTLKALRVIESNISFLYQSSLKKGGHDNLGADHTR